jgi:D-sedoheptulose 7-phosphate isomerase
MKSLVQQIIDNELKEAVVVKQALANSPAVIAAIQQAAQMCVAAYEGGHKILIAGNGGSAADAQHMAAELSGRFNFDRPGIPAIALTSNTSAVTAIANDYGYDRVFSRQVQAYGQPGDVFVGISTSGNSTNIVTAIDQCKTMGIETIGLTGALGGKMLAACDVCIQIPSERTARVQECHILIVHMLCAVVEESLFGPSSLAAKAVTEVVSERPEAIVECAEEVLLSA